MSSATTLPVSDTSTPPRARYRTLARAAVLSGLLAVLAFVVRAVGLRSANELFIDELTYSRLAEAVGRGQLPNLSGAPFLLHPPGSFGLNGAVIALLGLTGDKMQLAFQLRWVTAVLGAIVVALAVLIARRTSSTPTAAVVGLVLVFDPFLLRNDSRVMLETPTTAAILAGLLLLLVSLNTPHRRRWGFPVAAGLLFGLAIFTKDVAVFFTVLPVALATAWRATLPLRTAAVVVAASTVPYLLYLLTLSVNGQLGLWWAAKAVGVSRLSGATQITGFNAPGAPSLTEQLTLQLTRFGTSYLLIGLCVVAGVALVGMSAAANRRIVGLVAITGGLLGLYALTVGTLEEQYGYYVTVFSAIALAVVAAELLERRPSVRPIVLAFAGVFTALTVVLGVVAQLTTDDGYAEARLWLETNTAANTRVALTSPTAEFAFLPQNRSYGVWPSLTSIKNQRAEYVLTQSRPVSQGYGYASPDLLAWLRDAAQPAFTTTGPTGGETTIWRIDSVRLDNALREGRTIPPVTGTHP